MSFDFAQYDIVVRDNYALFWGSPFSNWYKSKFIVKGMEFNCVEQFMMACKALQFNDRNALDLIMSTSDPRKQKAYGRSVKGYDDKEWEALRYPVVREGVFAKFDQNIQIQPILLATNQLILVEASPKDTIWGIGLDANHPDATNPGKWKGTNLLGMALMDGRSTLQNMQED
jgi:ribA/ribD-fused uncharacterized protein